MESDEMTDALAAIVSDEEVDLVLGVLVSTIIATVGRCDDPHRALLGVIADLTDRIRFAERNKGETTALSLDEWIVDAWQEAEEPNPLADWNPQGKPQ